MRVGVQFTGTVAPNATQRWFTYNWPETWHVAWNVVPTSPQSGAPQIDWDVEVERATPQYITYWVNIRNMTSQPVNIEARYAVLN
ncbi:MAG: hypothetical protein JST84_16285 [Acidobacteria bacterium]|nr:hypothetical protein [Acidobacteriota bacterium]